MASDYTEPTWAVTPSSEYKWSLLEIKGGVEVASYRLDKKCIVLGRASQTIPLLHESCSRHHARIAFDQNGIPWLRDLHSSHGTTVNRKRLPPAAIGKMESTSTKSGARGVILYPGDVLQFGASTRLYCLEGPAEYERGAVRNVEPVKEKNEAVSPKAQSSAADNNNKKEQDGGFSWGMADAEEDVGDNHNTIADKSSVSLQPLDPATIAEKHRKLYEKLTAKQYKLQNVQRESERIRSKGSELSQGQEAQLLKNDERIKIWQEEIDEMEQELHKKLHPDKKNTPQKRKAHFHQDGDEDDSDYDFYDRTKDSQDDLFQDGETQESLAQKWKDLLGEWKQCSSSLLESRQKVTRLEQRVQAADPSDEDAFFLQNDLDLQKDSLSKCEERKQEIAHNLGETERLLHVVNANLEFNRETGFIGEPGAKVSVTAVMEESTAATTTDTDDTAMMPPPVSALSPAAPPRTMSPAASMPPPSKLPPPLNMPPPTQDDSMPPPKRTRIMGPTMPPPQSTIAVDEMEMPPPQRNTGHAAPPIIGTLSILAAAASAKRDGKNHHSPKKKDGKHDDTNTSFDPKKDVWKAPEGQDGSGITKLNAKFAGRY